MLSICKNYESALKKRGLKVKLTTTKHLQNVQDEII